MDKIKIFPKFIDEVTCQKLSEAATSGIADGWMGKGYKINDDGTINRQYDLRLTSRMYAHNIKYPDIVYDVANKVRAYLSIDQYPIIAGHGNGGAVVSITYHGGDVHKHRDPRVQIDGVEHAAYRCNILTQKPTSGGILHLEDRPIDLNVGDLHCYLASETDHFVSEVHGDIPRILWMFGAAVPIEEIALRSA